MAIYSDVNREVGERAGALSSFSGVDIVEPVNLKEDDLWKKYEHCSGCRWWKRRMRRGYWSWPMRLGGSVLG
jgi:hypothetical protein